MVSRNRCSAINGLRKSRSILLRVPVSEAKTTESSQPKARRGHDNFYAESECAESIFREARGDGEVSIAAQKRALEATPPYVPVILSMGSVEHQARIIAEGREFSQSLLRRQKNTTNLWQIMDEAGTVVSS
jgi:hypothetical protein